MKRIYKSGLEKYYFRLRNNTQATLDCLEEQMYADGCNWGINAVVQEPLITALLANPKLLKKIQEMI